jgi:hypothetical protein
LLVALACVAFPHAVAARASNANDDDADSRRARKAAFYSGNAGTTFFEVSAVIAAAPLGVFIRRGLDVMKGVRVTFGGIVADNRGKPLHPTHVVLKDVVFCAFPVSFAMFEPKVTLPALVVLALLTHAAAR